MTKLLRVHEAANTLGISRSKAYLLIQQGRLRTLQLDGAMRILESDLDEFIAALPADVPGQSAPRGKLVGRQDR
jgi:excisionase family DNA binding protein